MALAFRTVLVGVRQPHLLEPVPPRR